MSFIARIRVLLLCILMVAGAIAAQPVFAATTSGDVVVIDISGEIDGGQTALVRRGIDAAQAEEAKAVVVQINTLGGQVDSALKIRDMLVATQIPTVAYVRSRAWSAGALIALSCRHIVMAPGSSIGAAEPIPNSEKNIAALKSEFSATATRTGHNPRVAEAMVDKTIGYPGYVEAGQILSLSDVQAKRLNLSDGTADDIDSALRLFSITGADVTTVDRDWKDSTVGILQNQYVRMLLVGVILAAVLAEIKMAGIGIGIMTAILLGALLMITGDDTLGDSLKIVGAFAGSLLLIGLELVTPGVGIFGIIGVLLLFGSLFYMLGANLQALFILAGGIIIAGILFYLVIRRLPKSRLFSEITLQNRSTKEKGYTSQGDKSKYLHKRGTTITILRPAGVVRIDGKRVDAVSNGGFIDRDVAVRVVQVDGSRVVVEPVMKPE